MSSTLLQQIYVNSIHSLAAFIILSVVYLLAFFTWIRKLESGKIKKRFKLRLFYCVSFIFVAILMRIWVVGFTHLLTVLGLVSAALVVTNKETIMNFTGWFIILWRGLFTEDDYIEIQQHKGYIRRIGPLYFTLSEMSSVTDNQVSGRIVKIPNGWVITNVVVNHSQKSYLLKMQISVIFSPQSDIELAKKTFLSSIEETLQDYAKEHVEYHETSICRKNKNLKNLSHIRPSLSLKPKFEKPSGIQMTGYYFCYAKDQDKIERLLWEKFLMKVKNVPDIELTFEGYTA